MNETVQKIRNDLRRAMNGVVAASMRDKGLAYRVNFGVELPRLRQLADRYAPDAALARLLWREETRELKILATLLYPSDAFSEEEAQQWLREVPNQEIREQLCINLLQHLPFAAKLAGEWMALPDAQARTTGYWLAARLVLAKSGVAEAADRRRWAEKAVADLAATDYFLRQSALNVLKFVGRDSPSLAEYILTQTAAFETSGEPLERELYASLLFEFAAQR